MRILFLTDNFVPENNAPAIRTFEHAKRWVARGADVTILTGAPNFPSGVLFEGYQNALWQSEMIDGIKVVRVWTFMVPNRGVLLRLLDFLSFMISSLIVGLFLKKPDVIIGTSPQFFTVVSAWVLARCKRCPFIFEIRDIWPDSVFAVDLKVVRFLVSLASRTASFLYRQADGIVVVTKATLDFLVSRGVDPAKIFLIPNGAELHRFQGTCEKNVKLAEALGISGRFVVGYIGTHGLAHSLETMVEAARAAEGKEEFSDVYFITVGSGACFEALRRRASDLSNFRMIGQIKHDDIFKYWSILDATVIHLRDAPLFRTVIPSKLFEAMAAGVPVLHGVRGESEEIVRSKKVGVCFTPQDPLSLLEAIRRIRTDDSCEDFKIKCLEGAKDYDRETFADTMLTCLEELKAKHV